MRFPRFLTRSTSARAASPMAIRDHEEFMTEAEIIDATYWAGFWSRLEHWMFLGVVITLALEFLALRFAEPHKEKLEHQRELKIAELTKDGQRLSKEAETARASIAEANARAAKAEKETAELQSESQKLRMGRALFFSVNKCREALRGRPTGTVEILWQRGVGDASFLAFVLGGCLRGDGGVPWWRGDNPKQVDDVPEGARPIGITVIGKTGGLFVFRQPSDALIDVIGTALGAGLDQSFGSVSAGIDRTLPDDTVRIFIGPIQ